MDKDKKTVIKPNPDTVVGAIVFLIMMVFCSVVMINTVFVKQTGAAMYNKSEKTGVALFVIAFIAMCILICCISWPLILGKLTVTSEGIEWRCLFMPKCALKFSEIKYAEKFVADQSRLSEAAASAPKRWTVYLSSEPIKLGKNGYTRRNRKTLSYYVTERSSAILYECMPEELKWLFTFDGEAESSENP